jgi:hypothetical protein
LYQEKSGNLALNPTGHCFGEKGTNDDGLSFYFAPALNWRKTKKEVSVHFRLQIEKQNDFFFHFRFFVFFRSSSAATEEGHCSRPRSDLDHSFFVCLGVDFTKPFRPIFTDKT